MKKLLAAAVLALVTLGGLALACGRYGPPRRVERTTPSTSSVPLTDPAVPR